MIIIKDGTEVLDSRLGRIASDTTTHLEKFPLTADTMPTKPSSMTFGVNWYEICDNPRLVRIKGVHRYVIGDTPIGRLRGGHAICGRHWELTDLSAWWKYYNQQREGRCVEFAKLRMMSHINRVRYDITSRWHYHTDQHADEWPGCYLGHNGSAYEGTSVRAGLEGLRINGAIPANRGGSPITMEEAKNKVSDAEGISTYRWAKNWNDVRVALNVPDYLPGVPINNSWGINYPKEVILLDSLGERLLREDGEFGIVTDR
jgi:hypothetical protein